MIRIPLLRYEAIGRWLPPATIGGWLTPPTLSILRAASWRAIRGGWRELISVRSTTWRLPTGSTELEFGAGFGRIFPGGFLARTNHNHAYTYPYIMLNYNFF